MQSRSPWPTYICLGFLGVAGALAILWMTPHGPGVTPDSTVYLAAAENLLSGQGYSARGADVTHFPPLFPLLVAAAGLGGTDLIQAARILNAILFGITLILVGIAVHQATDHDRNAAVLAPLLLLASAPLLSLHALALSEPLFIALSVADIILLSEYAATRNLRYLMALSITLGLTLATRYVGIALVPATIIVLFLAGRDQRPITRVRDEIVFLAVACVPLSVILVRNTLRGGAATDRHLVFHPMSSVQAREFVLSIFHLLGHPPLPSWLVGTMIMLPLAGFTFGLILISRQSAAQFHLHSLARVTAIACLLFFVSYTLFLFTSISLFDAATHVDTRLLAPAFVWLVVAFFGAVWDSSTALKMRPLRWCLVLLIVFAACFQIRHTVAAASQIRARGQGYTSRQWRNSKTIEFVRQLPRGARIYSNGPDAITFLTHRPALNVPTLFSPFTLETNKDFKVQMARLCSDVQANGALLVYFRAFAGRRYTPTQDELLEGCDLRILYRFPDGFVDGKP